MTDVRLKENHDRAGALGSALDAWVRTGDSAGLIRWMDRELSSDGAPIRLSLPEWTKCLGQLVEAKQARKGWPKQLDERLIALVRSLLRFSRADGTTATVHGSEENASNARANLSSFAKAYPRTREARVIGWWLALPDSPQVAPPLPAWSCPQQVLAVLRAGWKANDDFLCIDHREGGLSTIFELIGSGIPWMGSDWRLVGTSESTAQAKPGCWVSNSLVDLAEWSFRAGKLQVTRSAILFRGLRLAILGEQIDGKAVVEAPIATRFALPYGVNAEPLTENRGLLLRASGRRQSAQVLPVALPALPYETERGHFQAEEDGLTLSMTPRGRRSWRPLAVSWDALRNRKRLSWRVLTVSENSRACDPEVAFAARISWGRNDTLVLYRSLAPPAPRAFLGHQTKARFLVGKFNDEGCVEPLVSLD